MPERRPDDEEAIAIPLWLRERLPDAVLGGFVLVAAVLELQLRGLATAYPAAYPVILLLALATALVRVSPGTALVLVWLLGAVQLANGVPVLATEVTVLLVLFGGARWGSLTTLVLSGVSVPAATVVIGLAAVWWPYQPGLGNIGPLPLAVARAGGRWSLLLVLLAVLAMLGASWLTGLVFRLQDRAAASRREQQAAQREAEQAHGRAAQAYEIAELRSGQAQLARDVHDVVGHSLAVILAQAESAQFVPDDEPARLKQILAAVATTARTSLRDVQQVLSAEPQPPGGLQSLIDGAGSTGRPVESAVHGSPRPLPPELAAVAYRVLQEMLTNAIKHGDRAVPVQVEQDWPGAEGPLVIRVRNGLGAGAGPMAGGPENKLENRGGMGIDGMRRRLAAVGGVLKVDAGPGAFAVTAWVPVRGS